MDLAFNFVYFFCSVFDDVATALKSWTDSGKRKVCIYSTGSIESQKMLFGKSSAGDLTSLINTHFDQSVGLKTQSESYKNIAQKLECEPETIVFLTDNVEGKINICFLRHF